MQKYILRNCKSSFHFLHNFQRRFQSKVVVKVLQADYQSIPRKSIDVKQKFDLEPKFRRKYKIFRPKFLVNEGEQVAIWGTNGIEILKGPVRVNLYGKHYQNLKPFSADESSYLSVRNKDGTTEVIQGPVQKFYDPRVHEEIVERELIKLQAKECIVVYKKEDKIEKYLVEGPDTFMLRPNEWVHEFNWYPKSSVFINVSMLPEYLKLKLSTNHVDNPFLNIKVKFQIQDVFRMIYNSADPISDLINAIKKDVIYLLDNGGNLDCIDHYHHTTALATEIGVQILDLNRE